MLTILAAEQTHIILVVQQTLIILVQMDQEIVFPQEELVQAQAEIVTAAAATVLALVETALPQEEIVLQRAGSLVAVTATHQVGIVMYKTQIAIQEVELVMLLHPMEATVIQVEATATHQAATASAAEETVDSMDTF